VIRLAPHSCVRYRSLEASCRRCAESCPVGAIEPKPLGLGIDPDACVDCGACMGSCPTEALELPFLRPIDFAFSFLRSEEEVISCKRNFSCLAGLGSEYLIALGVAKRVVLDVGHCRGCRIEEPCFGRIEEQVAIANYVLEAIDREPVAMEPLGVEPGRRDFFGALARGVAGLGEETATKPDPQKMRQKELPPKRKLLQAVLAQAEPPGKYRYLENEHLDFISDKSIDRSCDDCSLCYRLCPTGAIFEAKGAIRFRPLDCVRCHLCHDVCQRGSLGFEEYFDTKELFEPRARELIAFVVEECEDCGAPFVRVENERLCPRCRAEEDDAKELWGLS